MNRKLKIFMVLGASFPSWQGTQVYIGEQIEAVARRGHKIILLSYAGGAKEYKGSFTSEQWKEFVISPLNIFNKNFATKIKESLNIYNIIHLRLADFPHYDNLNSGPNITKILLDIQLPLIIRYVTSNIKFDIIYSHHIEALIASVFALPKIPIIYHAHTYLKEELPSYFENKLLARICSNIAPVGDFIFPRFSDLIISISPFYYKKMINYGIDEIVYIPAGININKAEMDIKNSKINNVLCYAGNLDPYQGIEEMFDGIGEVLLQLKDWNLHIITNSDITPKIKKVLPQKDKVKIINFKSWREVENHIEHADICLIPRLTRGGFPIKLLNYLNKQKCVIVRDRAVEGIDIKDGVCIVYKKEDWAEKIKELALNPEKRQIIAKTGKKILIRDYDIEKSIDLLEEKLYNLTSFSKQDM